MFVAGAAIFGHRQAKTVVVSMSSAIPWASFAITLAVAGAMITASAFFASAICSTLMRRYGVEIAEPDRGYLACGDVGAGKMPEPETLAEYVYKACAHAVTPQNSYIVLGHRIFIHSRVHRRSGNLRAPAGQNRR